MDAGLSEQNPALRLANLAWWVMAAAMIGQTFASLPGYLHGMRDNTFLDRREA